jgi:Protein of unknown function (DUF998)
MTNIERQSVIRALAGVAPVRGVASRMTVLRRPWRRAMPSDRPIPWWVLTCAGLCSTLLTSAWLIADALQPATYSPVHQTVSVLAGHAGAHRWIVTTALVLVGACYVVTALGMTVLRLSARVGLVVSGAAATGIALSPEPVKGTTTQHMAFTTVGAAAIAVWPALTVRRGPGVSAVVSVPVTTAATAVFMGLLAWLFFEAQTDGRVGLAERLDSSIQAFWPFVVAVAHRSLPTRSTRSEQPASGRPSRTTSNPGSTLQATDASATDAVGSRLAPLTRGRRPWSGRLPHRL